MFYQFHQNNSGGFFEEPALNVIIEAASAEEANDIAEASGIYFNGCDDGIDCDCCGDRWTSQWSDDYGKEVPSDYSDPLDLSEQTEPRKDFAEDEDLPSFLIIYKDGTRKELK